MSEGTAGADFAALLRQLKDRSGLSYGVLGKRLHMSTSTLHRYCNGDAVPTDYAPVERLARLCKASPEELVELHRRWVLADALRGRKTAGETGEGAVAGGVSAAGDPGVPQVADTASEDATVSEPASADVTVSEPVPANTPAPVRPSHPVRPGRHPRRRTTALAAAGVAVVLGAVALAVTLPSGGTRDDGGRGGPVGAAASKDVAAPPRKTPSESPSKSAEPDGTNSPSPSATPTKPATEGAAGPAEKPDAKPPFTVNTRPYSWEHPCEQHYLIDRPASAVRPPPVEQDAPGWIGRYKAVSAGEQLVTVTVQGRGGETVVLDSLKVRVVDRDTPLAWNDYVMGVGCGGNVPPRPFTVALDGAQPAVVAGAGQQDFPFTVSESDPEVFRITADASAYDVSWYLELAWSSGDRKGTFVIDDDGRPFRTSGNNGRPAYEFPLGGDKWLESVKG
ncbi:helix-turn-helix domain-containing protein [Streptomyces sp. NPDC093568]|uniref:helix-turn-helix domain-containing protein n=1 Tax=Streptomyces sp. NPDC093568 TaxID=3366041 RepID=UPI0037F6325A